MVGETKRQLGIFQIKQFKVNLISTLSKAGEELTVERYLTTIFLPLTMFGFLTSFVLKFYIFSLLNLGGPILLAPYALPVLCLAIALAYPFAYISARGKDIDTKIHLFTTYIGVLSTTGSERRLLFSMASEKKEYGVVAQEMKKILKIADSWNMGFVKACRVIAKTTPSIIFKDFLDRLAHAFQVGGNIQEFLRQEIDVVMNDYERMYRQALYKIEAANSLYIHMIITLAFIGSFALIFPLLIGYEITNVLYGMVVVFIAIDVAMFMFVKSVTPSDDLLHTLPIKTKGQLQIEKTLLPVAFFCLLIFVVLMLSNSFSLPVVISASQTPWLVVGIMSGREEAAVKRKDDNFPTFIRSVGSSAGVRGGSVTPVIASLRLHDYGPLTEDIKALHRRLTLGDMTRSWRYFAGESGSNLIDKFSRIFVEASHAGGDPAVVGETLSKNFSRINTLRKFRQQSGSTLKGMLYNAMLGISISIYITVGLVLVLGEVLAKYTAGSSAEYLPSKISTGTLNIDFIAFLIWLLILIHAFLSAVIIKIVDGGDMYNALVHYVIMTWMGVFVMLATPKIFEILVPI